MSKYIKPINPYAYKRADGELPKIVDVVMYTPDDKEPRLSIKVEYKDGMIDHISASDIDAGNYEIVNGKEYNVFDIDLDEELEAGFWGAHKDNKGGVRINWTCENVGWGQLTFIQDNNNNLICDSEHMSKEFVKAVMMKFIDSCKFR